jgi:hypothetical protein
MFEKKRITVSIDETGRGRRSNLIECLARICMMPSGKCKDSLLQNRILQPK